MIVVPDTSQFESKMALARKNTPVIWRRFSRKPRKFFGAPEDAFLLNHLYLKTVRCIPLKRLV